MTFLVDAQLPPALARWLIQQGHTAQHGNDIGLREAADTEIWNQALSTGAILVTEGRRLCGAYGTHNWRARNPLAPYRQCRQSEPHAMADSALGADYNSSGCRPPAHRGAVIRF
ncbi:MAG: DUF5615 family PIN-like protein [Pyrinomonadaceae bacterium]